MGQTLRNNDMANQTLEQLRERFRDPRLHFDIDRGGLVKFHAQTALGELKLYLHGAHVTHWQPSGQKPVLFLSKHSSFEPGKPIRGGVPICFPWFGANAGDSSLPMHGLARVKEWTLEHAAVEPEGIIEAELHTTVERFDLAYFVRASDELQLRLKVRNMSSQLQQYEVALHTYLAVGDVRQVFITGLGRRRFIDKTRDGAVFVQERGPVGIDRETDRVYLDTIQSVVVHDPIWKRRLIVDKDGSRSTVVWNPWVEKSKRLADFGDEEWPGMLCIETANVADNRVSIEPGQLLAHEAVLRVEND